MKKNITLLLLLLFSTHLLAQETPELIKCDMGFSPLSASLEEPRFVKQKNVFTTFNIRDSIKVIDSIKITLNYETFPKNTQFLKKSLIDLKKLKPKEYKLDPVNKTIEIVKKNLNHTHGVSTHFITLYFNKIIDVTSMNIKIWSGKKRYFSENINVKKIE